MKSIGLPPNVIYACLAETIVLALEGRFEVFTIGRDTEWEKVKEIYKLGLKHGMKLAAISGVNGPFTDEHIANVVKLAKKARLTWKGGSSAAAPAKKTAAPRRAQRPSPLQPPKLPRPNQPQPQGTGQKKAPSRKTASA